MYQAAQAQPARGITSGTGSGTGLPSWATNPAWLQPPASLEQLPEEWRGAAAKYYPFPPPDQYLPRGGEVVSDAGGSYSFGSGPAGSYQQQQPSVHGLGGSGSSGGGGGPQFTAGTGAPQQLQRKAAPRTNAAIVGLSVAGGLVALLSLVAAGLVIRRRLRPREEAIPGWRFSREMVQDATSASGFVPVARSSTTHVNLPKPQQGQPTALYRAYSNVRGKAAEAYASAKRVSMTGSSSSSSDSGSASSGGRSENPGSAAFTGSAGSVGMTPMPLETSSGSQLSGSAVGGGSSSGGGGTHYIPAPAIYDRCIKDAMQE